MIAAQNAETVYLQQEHDRLLRVANHESAIQNYINQNISSYSIQSTAMDKIMSRKHEDGSNFTPAQLDDALQIHKQQALRNLYFSQNPSIIPDYTALPLTTTTACVNNGFENGDLSGFSFFSLPFDNNNGHPVWEIFENFPVVGGPISSTNGKIKLVEKGTDTKVPNLPMVKDGNYAIRLNSPDGGFDVSLMSRIIPVTKNNISFNYSLVLEDPGPSHVVAIPGHPELPPIIQKPYYQCRLKTQSGVVVFERKIIADLNNKEIFKTVPESIIVYTGWLCEDIDVSQYIGQDLVLELILGDCGQSAHFGYGYFDNFCGTKCSAPTLGTVTLDPMGITCPLLPLTVSGNFVAPAGTELVNLTLTAKSGNNIIYTSPPGDYNLSANEFSFKVTGPQLSLTQGASTQFDFFVKAKFKVVGENSYYEVDSQSANTGADVTFNSSCKICNACTPQVYTKSVTKGTMWCIGGRLRLTGASPITLYSLNNETDIMDQETLYTDASLSNPYTGTPEQGYLRDYGGKIYWVTPSGRLEFQGMSGESCDF